MLSLLCAGGPLCGAMLSAQDTTAVLAEHNWWVTWC